MDFQERNPAGTINTLQNFLTGVRLGQGSGSSGYWRNQFKPVDWLHLPEVEKWWLSIKDWKTKFEPLNFVGSDDSGFAEHPGIRKMNNANVWTEQWNAGGLDIITPGFVEGEWDSGGAIGWYLMQKPWVNSEDPICAELQLECPICSEGFVDQEDCLFCECTGEIVLNVEDFLRRMTPPEPIKTKPTFSELETLRSRADSGDLDSILELARHLDQSGSLSDAIVLWRKAAARGSARAMHNLGSVAEEQKDFVSNEMWWLMSAELGYLDAIFSLGVFYKNQQRMADAKKWWTKAAELGDEQARKCLEIMKLIGEDPDESNYKVWQREANLKEDSKKQVQAATTLENKAKILGKFWMDYRDDIHFADFIEYNDLGLPLAYAYANGIIENLSSKATNFINEAFDLLLESLNIEQDRGYADLEQLLEDRV